MELEVSAASSVGRVRELNEDYYLVDEELKFFIVCDGMGGHAAGEVAAENAAQLVASYLREHKRAIVNTDRSPDGHFRLLQLAEKAVERACAELYRMASSTPEYAGMGTTLTLLVIANNKAIMAHVGDSQLYLSRESQLHLLSTDHTLANELVVSGRLGAKEGATSRFRNVLTRSLGPHESVDVETLIFDLVPGDVLLLCTDGLTRYFEHRNEISAYLDRDSLGTASQRLVQIANERGGADNVTAVVVTIPGSNVASGNACEDFMSLWKSTFLFKGLSLGRLMRVSNVSSRINLAEGDTVLRTGDMCEGFYVVLAGHVSGRGSKFLPGDSFGAESLFQKHVIREDLVAVTPAVVMRLSGQDFRGLTRRFPKLGRRLLSNLCNFLSCELQKHLDDDFSESDTWVEYD
jgi:serine/threonine protein phosphatase PrpC